MKNKEQTMIRLTARRFAIILAIFSIICFGLGIIFGLSIDFEDGKVEYKKCIQIECNGGCNQTSFMYSPQGHSIFENTIVIDSYTHCYNDGFDWRILE